MTNTLESEEVKKRFCFIGNSWWDSQGCSCCEATLMEAYNSGDTDPSLGTAHSKLECYIQAISTVIIKRNHSYDFDPEVLYWLEEVEIESLCKAMGIEVEIHG